MADSDALLRRGALTTLVVRTGLPAIVIAGAGIAALAVAVLLLEPPSDDVVQLALYLVVSGGISLAVGYAGLARLGRAGIGGVRLRIVFGHVLVIAVAFINIAVTATLMFLSWHDFVLLGALLLFASILAVFFSFALAREIACSVRGVADAARRMAAGDLSARAPIITRDELGELAQAFNQMASQLEQAARRQREVEQARRDLVVAVSHDLRTPLASIQAMIEAINDRVVSDEATVERYLKTTQSETERLAALIDDLFELSQIEAGALHLHVEVGSIGDLISDTIRSLAAHAERRGVRLAGSVDPFLPSARFDPSRVQRVLDNLVTNALRHAKPGGVVDLHATGHDRHVEIAVQDDGEGISPEEIPHVFERFYRGERSRSRESGGAGLGLTIARGIIAAHGGRIWVESTPGHGTVFRFTLPRADSG